VLALGVAGGVLGALSTPNALSFLPFWNNWNDPPQWFGILGGICLGVAAFFTRELLSPEREGRWVRARAAAEAFKRESYLMAAQAPPYAGAVTPASLDRAGEINATTADMQEVAVPEEKRIEGLLPCPITVDKYIEVRLEDQMNYYRNKAGAHAKVVERIRNMTFVLGVGAVVLGYLISNQGLRAGVWLSVITATTTSLTAYLYARRLQYLVISYLAAARNLEALSVRWGTSGKTDADTAERNQFILDCEKILSSENSSWISEWFKKETPTAPPAAGRPAELAGGAPAGNVGAGAPTRPAGDGS
jgi:hypothetical protein